MQVLALDRHNNRTVTALAFAPDGRALVASPNGGAPVRWDLPAAGDPVPLVDWARPAAANLAARGVIRYQLSHSLAFSADGQVVSWVVSQVRVERDRRAADACPAELTPAGEGVLRQARGGTDGRLVVWTHEASVGDRLRAFTPDGNGGWVGAWAVGPVRNISTGWYYAQAVAAARADYLFTLEVPPLGQGGPRRLVVRSALTGEAVEQVAVPSDLHGLVAAPDGTLAVGFKGSSLYAWRPGGPVEKVRTGTRKHYRGLAFHPDGRHLLAGNNDTTARLIDTRTWQVTRQFVWDIGALSEMAVSPDGTLAAAGGAKGRVVVWDLDL